jgi:hypothetical protein
MLHTCIERFNVIDERRNILGWDVEVNKALPKLFPLLIHIYVDQGIPVPVGPPATPCVAALPPGSHKCAGGWPPHARCAPRACARLPPRTSSPLPQPAVPCCCPCSSGHLPSAAASPPFPTADQDPSRLRLGTRLTKIVSWSKFGWACGGSKLGSLRCTWEG